MINSLQLKFRKIIVNNKSLNSYFKVLVLSLCCIVMPVFGHGSTVPKHGGVVKISGEMSFEFVIADGGVKIFLLDDGEEVDSAQLTARLIIKNAGDSTTVALTPSGGNSFSAPDITLAAGSKVLTLVTLANTYSTVGANFVVE